MKKSVLNISKSIAIAAFGITMLVACNQNSKPKDSEKIANEQNDKRFDDRNSEKDAQFLVDAAIISMEEIKLGKLALTKSSDEEVKNLAKMMVDQHEKALSDEKALAGSKSVALPANTPDDVIKAYDDLNAKKGWDFDEAYTDKMVKGHEKAIKKFENYIENAQDTEILNWATTLLPELRNHLNHAQIANDEVSKRKM